MLAQYRASLQQTPAQIRAILEEDIPLARLRALTQSDYAPALFFQKKLDAGVVAGGGGETDKQNPIFDTEGEFPEVEGYILRRVPAGTYGVWLFFDGDQGFFNAAGASRAFAESLCCLYRPVGESAWRIPRELRPDWDGDTPGLYDTVQAKRGAPDAREDFPVLRQTHTATPLTALGNALYLSFSEGGKAATKLKRARPTEILIFRRRASVESYPLSAQEEADGDEPSDTDKLTRRPDRRRDLLRLRAAYAQGFDLNAYLPEDLNIFSMAIQASDQIQGALDTITAEVAQHIPAYTPPPKTPPANGPAKPPKATPTPPPSFAGLRAAFMRMKTAPTSPANSSPASACLMRA